MIRGPPRSTPKPHSDRTLPSGPCYLPDWKVFLPTGTSFVPDWKVFRPGGRSFVPDWKVFRPGGTSFVPEGRIFRPTGRSFIPDWKLFPPKAIADWPWSRPAVVIVPCTCEHQLACKRLTFVQAIHF